MNVKAAALIARATDTTVDDAGIRSLLEDEQARRKADNAQMMAAATTAGLTFTTVTVDTAIEPEDLLG